MILGIGIVILFIVLFSLYGFWVATHPQKFVTNVSPSDLSWEFEEIMVTTQDGIRLAAWLVPHSVDTWRGKPASDKVIILLHGYPTDKANLLQWSQFLHEDFNLFFLDFRYFGDSQGSLTTIGFKEQQDVRAAINYLEKRGFTKIGAMGFSLGGSVAMLTAAKDQRLKTIVSDSPFASIELMGHEFYRELFVLKYPLTFLTKLWARIFLDFNPDEIAPQKAASQLQIPILLIHSKKDQTIPFENALRIQKTLAKNPEAEFFFLDEGTHGYLPDYLRETYEKKVLEFFKQHL